MFELLAVKIDAALFHATDDGHQPVLNFSDVHVTSSS
jgi:hypothetical protein